jgi:hypothetical protein
MSQIVFKRDTKRTPSGLECPTGTSRTLRLRTTPKGKWPAESGIPVPTLGINSDTKTGSPVLNKRERGRSGPLTSQY